MRFHVAQMCGISSLTSQMSGFCCSFNKCTRCYRTFAKNNFKNPLKQVKISRKTFIRKWMTYKAPAFRTTKKAHVGFKKYFLNPNSLLLHIINKTLSDLFIIGLMILYPILVVAIPCPSTKCYHSKA